GVHLHEQAQLLRRAHAAGQRGEPRVSRDRLAELGRDEDTRGDHVGQHHPAGLREVAQHDVLEVRYGGRAHRRHAASITRAPGGTGSFWRLLRILPARMTIVALRMRVSLTPWTTFARVMAISSCGCWATSAPSGAAASERVTMAILSMGLIRCGFRSLRENSPAAARRRSRRASPRARAPRS